MCFDLAHVLAEAGHAQASVERYVQAVELRPDAADAWNNLGVLVAGLGRPLAACTAFRRALAAAPLDARARYNLADTLEETGRPADAAEHWRRTCGSTIRAGGPRTRGSGSKR